MHGPTPGRSGNRGHDEGGRIKPNPHLHRTVMEILDSQIRDNEPPETRQTYERLLAEGLAEPEVRRLLGVALVTEIFHMMKNREVFNRQRFVGYLNRLPQEPSDGK